MAKKCTDQLIDSDNVSSNRLTPNLIPNTDNVTQSHNRILNNNIPNNLEALK